MARYLGPVVGAIIGVGLLCAIPLTQSDPDDCGGQTMSPGDSCVSNKGGSYGYEENRDRVERANTTTGACMGLIGGGIIVASIVSAVRKSQAVANAPERQARWPVPTDLGPGTSTVDLGGGAKLSLHANGFAYTDDTGVTHAAHWPEITDTKVTITNNVAAAVELRVAGHEDKVAFSGTASALRPFIDKANASAVEYQFRQAREILLEGGLVFLDSDHLAIDRRGLIRFSGGNEEVAPWPTVTVGAKNGYAYVFGGDEQWGGFRLLGPGPAARFAILEMLTGTAG